MYYVRNCLPGFLYFRFFLPRVIVVRRPLCIVIDSGDVFPDERAKYSHYCRFIKLFGVFLFISPPPVLFSRTTSDVNDRFGVIVSKSEGLPGSSAAHGDGFNGPGDFVARPSISRNTEQ